MANLQSLVNDPDFLSLPESEQDSIIEQAKSSQAQEQPQEQGGLIRNMIPAYHTPLKPIYDTAVNAYNAIREPLVDTAQKIAPIPLALNTFDSTHPNQPLISKENPISKIPTIASMYLSNRPANQVSKDVAGVGVDAFTIPFGVEGVGAAANATKSGIPSLIKQFIKPFRTIGEDITPKAVGAIQENISSMNPKTLKSLGISDESINTAKNVGERVGLTELPSKPMADKYYQLASESMPEDIRIPTTNISKVEINPKSGIDKETISKIKSITGRTNFNESGTLSSSNMTKQEYQSLRSRLVDLDPNGQDGTIQNLKHALDKDAGIVSPEVDKANGTFQVSRELSKASTYSSNPKINMHVQNILTKAQKPSETATREYLRNLLGNKADEILGSLDKNRKSKFLVKGAGAIASIPIIKKLGLGHFLLQ